MTDGDGKENVLPAVTDTVHAATTTSTTDTNEQTTLVGAFTLSPNMTISLSVCSCVVFG